MAATLVSETPQYASLTGRDDVTGVRTYEAVYLVRVDDPRDGPRIAKTASGIPQYPSFWKTPTESDPDAWLIDRNAEADPEKTDLFYVRCTFSTEANAADGQAGAGALVPEQKEIDLAPELEWDFIERDVAQYAAYGAELWRGNKLIIKLTGKRTNGRVPICNSARDFFDPPIQEDEARLVLRISRAVGSYSPLQAAEYANVLNSDTWLGFPPGTLLLKPIRAKAVFDKGVSYFRTSVEIHVRFDGHTHDIWDAGLREYWSAKDAKTVLGKKQGYTHIKNEDQSLVTEPVLLDGEGHALLKPGQALDLVENQPSYWKFRTRKMLPFGPLKLL